MINYYYKIAFTSGPWRSIEADGHVLDERLLVLMKDGRPILTAVLDNVNFFECEELGKC
jgi:hypothetical protein